MFIHHHAALYLAALYLVALATIARAQTTATLSPAQKASGASSISPILSASFAGFGIEPSNLFSFTGGETANQLSVGLLQTLADYSGAPPHIRLGGNTQDYALYDATFTAYECAVNTASTAQGTYAADGNIIGPAYFTALDRFPTNTPVTFGLNMAYYESDYVERIVTMAQAAVDGMNNVKLYSFEIGNEPDLWLANGFRNGSWDGAQYSKEFLARADAVYNQVLKSAGYSATFFEAQATASTIGTTFEIETLIDDGMTNATNGNNYISAWNQHDYYYFIGVTTTAITLDDLMDLDTTDTQFDYWKGQAAIAAKTNLPFVLREMSSIGPIGMDKVSNTHGAALWALNFFLYTATLNVSSVQMHMTDNSNSSAWQPSTLYGQAPHVRPQFYAHAAVAQIIGNGNATTQIAAVDVSSTNSDYTGRLRAYAAYSQESLRAVILINSKPANISSTTKGNFAFTINLGSSNANTKVYLSYLTADGSDSLNGTTWNGLSYSDTDGTASVDNDTVTSLSTSNSGSVTVTVRDSEAVVVNIGWQIGSVSVSGATAKKGSAERLEGSRFMVSLGFLVAAIGIIGWA